MRDREKIMLIGIGELGGIVLEFLCRVPGICDIITADSNKDWGFRKTNSAVLGAAYMGLYPRIEFCPVNLLDIEKTAEMLSKFNPTIIYNGTTLQSWWVVNELPPQVNAKVYRHRCGLGPWISMHLALTAKLMKAVQMAGIDTYVVNTSFPDVTNASLGRIGLAPTIGIGNGDLIIPYVQKTAAEKLSIPIANIDVELIAHHYHGYNWCRSGGGYEAPHHLKIFAKGQDVTSRLGDMQQFIADLPKHAMRPAGRHGQYLVAGSSVKNILAILNDSNLITNSPGPQGLEGGYPIRLSRQGAEILVPAGLTLDAARDLMLQAQQYDGIQEIKSNGDVVLTDEAYENFKQLFNVDCRTVSIDDSFEQARELRYKFEEFAISHGVVIPN